MADIVLPTVDDLNQSTEVVSFRFGSTTVHYLSREAWDADPGLRRRGYVIPLSQIVGLVLHHTVMVLQDYDRDGFLHGDLDDVRRFMRTLQKVRPDLGLDVPYSFVVFRTDDPNVVILCEGRGWFRTGAHTSGYNSTRFGIAYAGNTDLDPVTPAILDAVRFIGTRLTRPLTARATLRHSDVKATACPGARLSAALPLVQPPFVIPQTEETPLMFALDPSARRTQNGRIGAWRVDPAGRVVAENGAEHYGDLTDVALVAPIVDLVPTPTGNGYWLIGGDGGVFAYGDAGYPGRMDKAVVGGQLVRDGEDLRLALIGLDGAGKIATFKIPGSTGHKVPVRVEEVPCPLGVSIEELDGVMVAAELIEDVLGRVRAQHVS